MNQQSGSIMQKVQRFGGAMFTPVLLFAVFGILVGFSTLFQNPIVMGPIANSGTNWYKFWNTVYMASNTVFLQMPLLFAIGLPVALAKKQPGRACMETLVIYLIFNYYISALLTHWAPLFGVDFQSTARTSGLTSIAGIRTLDMGMVGAIFISGISVWLHNRFFDLPLPKAMETFSGTPLVTFFGFVVMFPTALAACVVWPRFQHLLWNFQSFLISTHAVGIWIYTFLERILIPTGLHHFIYAPFLYDSAVIDGGVKAYWALHLPDFATSTRPLVDLFPQGGFALTGMSKIFAPLGIGAAFYVTAKTERRKKVLSLIIPVVITASLAGITEPIEFTFLFVSPLLFLVHSILAATMSSIVYMAGITGDFSLGLIQSIALNWLPLFKTHGGQYLVQILIGLTFTVIYFVVFRFLILKFDFKTPGREEEDEETKFHTKAEYRARRDEAGAVCREQAFSFLEGLGGRENVTEISNCGTRLRLSVKNPAQVRELAFFKQLGAHGLMLQGNAVQIIVGLGVANVREEIEKLL